MTVARRILIVDDDRELCELVSELLRGEGFDVDCHFTGAGAADLATSGAYALVILDVMLPERNGFEILRDVRRRSAVPIILLTARGEDVDPDRRARDWRRRREARIRRPIRATTSSLTLWSRSSRRSPAVPRRVTPRRS
jgi:CheY-like chemotaxis protein